MNFHELNLKLKRWSNGLQMMNLNGWFWSIWWVKGSYSNLFYTTPKQFIFISWFMLVDKVYFGVFILWFVVLKSFFYFILKCYILLGRGWFKICGRCYGPLIAHLSPKACEKAWNATRSLSQIIPLSIVSRSQAWPRNFKSSPPTDDHIALFFFPPDSR